MASIRKRTWTSRGVERSAWICDYFDQAGKRHLKTFATKKEAEAWSVSALHEVKQGIHTPSSTSVTVSEATERWIAHCEAEDLEFSTIKQRRQHLNLHIAPFLGRERLSSLTMPRIHKFDSDLRAAGRSIAMRRKVLTNVKTMLTFCQGQGLVDQNVARGVKIKSDDRRKASGPLREGRDFPSKAEAPPSRPAIGFYGSTARPAAQLGPTATDRTTMDRSSAATSTVATDVLSDVAACPTSSTVSAPTSPFQHSGCQTTPSAPPAARKKRRKTRQGGPGLRAHPPLRALHSVKCAERPLLGGGANWRPARQLRRRSGSDRARLVQ
jgi:hypothetical protein